MILSILDIERLSRKKPGGTKETKIGNSDSALKLRKGEKKTSLIYLSISIIAVAVNQIYAIFAHGVSSHSMTFMFLYPLLGGALLYFFIEHLMVDLMRKPKYRIFFNIYISGLAALTFGSFLKGILEIAGTESAFTILFFIVGGLFTAVGFILLAGLTNGTGNDRTS